MFCSKCGKEIEEGTLVCPSCGATIRQSDQPETEAETMEQTRQQTPAAKNICGKPITLVLAIAMSVSAVFFLIMALITERNMFSTTFGIWADIIVPVCIYTLISIGCWVLYVSGRKNQPKGGGFMLIGAALVVEIFHWALAWFMCAWSNIYPFTVYSWDFYGDMTQVIIVITMAFSFFCVGAIGIQMVVSIRRSANAPGRKIALGQEAKWFPSRLSLGFPVILLVLTVMVYPGLFGFEVINDFYGDGNPLSYVSGRWMGYFPASICWVFLTAYVVANILALVIMVRIRRHKGGNENV